MHYKTDILGFPITGLEDFTGNFADEVIYKVDSAEIEIEAIPVGKEVLVLDYVRK